MPQGQPEIRTAAELLDLLRADPTRRAVCSYEPVVRSPFVVVQVDEDVRPVRQIAEIRGGSPAEELCDAAFTADYRADTAALEALPLRYGPWFNTWVLPEHPRAPTKPDATGWWWGGKGRRDIPRERLQWGRAAQRALADLCQIQVDGMVSAIPVEDHDNLSTAITHLRLFAQAFSTRPPAPHPTAPLNDMSRRADLGRDGT